MGQLLGKVSPGAAEAGSLLVGAGAFDCGDLAVVWCLRGDLPQATTVANKVSAVNELIFVLVLINQFLVGLCLEMAQPSARCVLGLGSLPARMSSSAAFR